MSDIRHCNLQEEWFFGHTTIEAFCNWLNLTVSVIIAIASIGVLVHVIFIRKQPNCVLILTPLFFLLYAICAIFLTIDRISTKVQV